MTEFVTKIKEGKRSKLNESQNSKQLIRHLLCSFIHIYVRSGNSSSKRF